MSSTEDSCQEDDKNDSLRTRYFYSETFLEENGYPLTFSGTGRKLNAKNYYTRVHDSLKYKDADNATNTTSKNTGLPSAGVCRLRFRDNEITRTLRKECVPFEDKTDDETNTSKVPVKKQKLNHHETQSSMFFDVGNLASLNVNRNNSNLTPEPITDVFRLEDFVTIRSSDASVETEQPPGDFTFEILSGDEMAIEDLQNTVPREEGGSYSEFLAATLAFCAFLSSKSSEYREEDDRY